LLLPSPTPINVYILTESGSLLISSLERPFLYTTQVSGLHYSLNLVF
jgi:hypothetical protein